MPDDYYSILGVERGASKTDIKKAFHQLARKYHPDNGSTGDESRFKKVNEAYQTLSDDKRRAEYDTYGNVFSGAGAAGASGPFGAGGFSGQWGDVDLGDIFSDFFTGAGRGGRERRGRDISIDLELSFEEAIFGVERSVLLGKTGLCDTCTGTGAAPKSGTETCKSCNGKGQMHEMRQTLLGAMTHVRECSECMGRGTVPKKRCRECNGVGVLKKQEEIKIVVPAGIQSGEVIRLSGAGEAVPNGVASDVYVRVHIAQHPVFKREGSNLVMPLDIKLSDALLGAEYSIETIDGTPLTLKIPAGVSFGEMLRVRGKGVPAGARRGDMLVKLNIRLPNKLSRKAKKLLKELKEEGI